jgi:uncharacterized protein YndB with AHSA1/START domain
VNNGLFSPWDTREAPAETFSMVAVEFTDERDGVEIRRTHRQLTTGQVVDMDVGWNNTFDSLEDCMRVETGPRSGSSTAEEK